MTTELMGKHQRSSQLHRNSFTHAGQHFSTQDTHVHHHLLACSCLEALGSRPPNSGAPRCALLFVSLQHSFQLAQAAHLSELLLRKEEAERRPIEGVIVVNPVRRLQPLEVRHVTDWSHRESPMHQACTEYFFNFCWGTVRIVRELHEGTTGEGDTWEMGIESAPSCTNM